MKRFSILVAVFAALLLNTAYGQVPDPVSGTVPTLVTTTTAPATPSLITGIDPQGRTMYMLGRYEVSQIGYWEGYPDPANSLDNTKWIPDTWVQNILGPDFQTCGGQILSYCWIDDFLRLNSRVYVDWGDNAAAPDAAKYITAESFAGTATGSEDRTYIYDVSSFAVGGPNHGDLIDMVGDYLTTQITMWTDRIPGDANFDGEVGFADQLILSGNWNTAVTGGWDDADFNNDGFVDFADFLIFSRYVGTGTDQ